VAKRPLLSIVVTSYTEARLKDIHKLLESVKAQSYPAIETIFVAERSVALLEKVKAHASERNIPNLKVIFNDGEPGLSAARNLGIKEAKGDIIAFVDDDTVLFPDWAEEMVKAYEDDSIIGVTGPALPLWENESMSWFPEELYWIISCTAWADWKEIREVRNAWGMNMSLRREAFEKAGYFITDFGLCDSSRKGWVDPPSEDVDLSIKIKQKTGKRIVYDPKVKVRHRVHKYRIGLRFIMRRSYSVGYQRRMLRRLYQAEENSRNLFEDEHRLLKRIFTRLFPSIPKTFFTNPVIAWHRLSVTITALTFVALGYYSHLFRPFCRQTPSAN